MEVNCKDCASLGKCGSSMVGCTFFRCKRPITKADCIRVMMDEELADFFARELDDGVPVNWLEWLRQVVT